MTAPSTSAELDLVHKTREHVALFRQYLARGESNFGWLFDELEAVQEIFTHHVGRQFESAIEIGFGPRPYRMRGLHALGIRIEGVDAEAPVLTNKPSEYVRVWRQNGFERFAKTLVRRTLFDRSEARAFKRELRRRGLPYTPIPRSAFAVKDAADFTPTRVVDVAYSVNVFEHIELDSLTRIVDQMPEWLVSDGLALIRPDIWTGLHGGHAIEWRKQTFDRPRKRRSEPWEHLRGNRYPANTTLNKLTRADYRELFSRRFEILDEIDMPRGREAEFLTEDIRAELSAYSAQDLLDANPLFVLRPSSRRAGGLRHRD